MSVAVVWLVIGFPALVLAVALFLDRSPVRALLGYLVLLAAFITMAFFDRASAGIVGAILALVYASGRGGTLERERTRDDEIGVPEVAIDHGHGHVGTSSG